MPYFRIFLFLIVCLSSLSAKLPKYKDYLELDENGLKMLEEKIIKKKDSAGNHLVTSGFYELHSNLSKAETLHWAIRMDSFHKRFESIFKGSFRIKKRPVLYIFREMPQYQGFISSMRINPGGSAGMYIPSKRLLVGQQAMGDYLLKQILFHEGTHQLFDFYMGEKILMPVWFNEGVANNFESWNIAKSVKLNIQESPLVSTRRAMVAETYGTPTFQSLRKVMSYNHSTWRTASNPLLNYAQTWSLINYMFSTKRGQKNFNLILSAIRSNNKKTLKNIHSAKTIRKLEEEWFEDIENRIIPYHKYIDAAYPKKKGEGFNIELLEEGIKAHPDLLDLHYYKGIALYKADRFEEALETFNKVEEREPPMIGLIGFQGMTYYHLKDYKNAKKFLGRAKSKEPEDKTILKTLEEIKKNKLK